MIANISNRELIPSSIPLPSDTNTSLITDMADYVKSILIHDLRYNNFLLAVHESAFANQSVLLAFVRYIKDYKICEQLLFVKTLIYTTGEQVCNAVTEILETNEISMDNMDNICTDGAPIMIGKKELCPD